MTDSIQVVDAVLMQLFFGFVTVLFTSTPFMYSFVHSLYAGRSGQHQAQEFSLLGSIVKALAWHFGACLFLVLMLKIIEILLLSTLDYDMKELIEGMWAANASDAADFAPGSTTIEMMDSVGFQHLKSALFVLSTIAHFIYGILPLFIVFLSMVMAIKISKSRPDASVFSRTWEIGLSFFVTCVVVVAWAKFVHIASFEVIDPQAVAKDLLFPWFLKK